ncbi:hypothetical protein P7C70_g3756, partial [Phenoliferia sp. Uapishka_3]
MPHPNSDAQMLVLSGASSCEGQPCPTGPTNALRSSIADFESTLLAMLSTSPTQSSPPLPDPAANGHQPQPQTSFSSSTSSSQSSQPRHLSNRSTKDDLHRQSSLSSSSHGHGAPSPPPSDGRFTNGAPVDWASGGGQGSTSGHSSNLSSETFASINAPSNWPYSPPPPSSSNPNMPNPTSSPSTSAYSHRPRQISVSSIQDFVPPPPPPHDLVSPTSSASTSTLSSGPPLPP